MRNAGIAALAAALALAAVADAGAGARAGAQPTLRFTALIPATARGTHFVPGEQVRVTLQAGAARLVRTTRASALGTFTVNFGTLAKRDRCSGSVSLTAVGARGDGARYRLPPMACPTTNSA